MTRTTPSRVPPVLDFPSRSEFDERVDATSERLSEEALVKAGTNVERDPCTLDVRRNVYECSVELSSPSSGVAFSRGETLLMGEEGTVGEAGTLGLDRVARRRGVTR
jgi:hypothetical protein